MLSSWSTDAGSLKRAGFWPSHPAGPWTRRQAVRALPSGSPVRRWSRRPCASGQGRHVPGTSRQRRPGPGAPVPAPNRDAVRQRPGRRQGTKTNGHVVRQVRGALAREEQRRARSGRFWRHMLYGGTHRGVAGQIGPGQSRQSQDAGLHRVFRAQRMRGLCRGKLDIGPGGPRREGSSPATCRPRGHRCGCAPGR